MFSKLLMRSLNVERHIKFRMFCHYLYQNNRSTINESIPGVSVSQIKQVLKQKNITIVEGHGCLVIECPICNSEKLKKAKIYVNKTTGNNKIIYESDTIFFNYFFFLKKLVYYRLFYM